MSNLIYGRWKQYFQMPIADRVEHLSPHAYRIYGLLCRIMNESSAVVIEMTNAEMAGHTGIRDHKTLKKARQELTDARLVELRRGPVGVYGFVMLSESGAPIEPPKGRKGVRHFKSAISITPAPQLPPKPPQPSTNATVAQTTRYCYTHRRKTEHWECEGQLICEECHPNPNEPEPPAPNVDAVPFRQPTAKELGF